MVLPALSLRPLLRGGAFAAVLAALALAGWLGGQSLVCVAHQDEHLIHTGQLTGERTVGQVFFCDRDGLARIETRMGTYGSWSSADFEFGLVEVASAAPEPRARLAPQDGAPVELGPDRSVVTLVQAARTGADGLRLVVSNPGRVDRGELVVALLPWETNSLEVGTPILLRRPLAEIGLRERVCWVLPSTPPSPPRPLLVSISLAGSPPEGFVNLHWSAYPAPHLPQVLEKPNRFWRAFKVTAHNPDDQAPRRLYPGQLILDLTYPPQVPLGPLLRHRVESSLGVSDNAFHPVSFAPLADSGGRTYHFFYQAPSAGLDQALTLWAHRRAGDRSHLTEDGTAVDGALCFRAYAGVSAKEAMNHFTAKLNEGKTGAWLSPWMITAALAVQILILAGICAFLTGRGGSGRKGRP